MFDHILHCFVVFAFIVGVIALVGIAVYVVGCFVGFVRECCQCGRLFLSWKTRGGWRVRCRACMRADLHGVRRS